MSAFWKHYEAAKPHMAAAVDDVRHKLVEEGWFGRQVTGNIAGQEAPAGMAEPLEEKAAPQHRHHTLYTEIWGKEPKASDLYGTSPAVQPAPGIGPDVPQQDKGLEPQI